MKTSEAQKILRDMQTKGQITYTKDKGLLLTEKAAGIALETLCELTTEQVSRIGQEFDPLFPTRKRVSGLLKDGVSADTLRSLLAELEGKTTEGGSDNAENNQGQLLLPGQEGEPATGGDNSVEGHTTADTPKASGENSPIGDIREGVNGGNNPGTSGGSRKRGTGGTV